MQADKKQSTVQLLVKEKLFGKSANRFADINLLTQMIANDFIASHLTDDVGQDKKHLNKKKQF